jgi:hypothetical protein
MSGWVNFQSATWVSFAPAATLSSAEIYDLATGVFTLTTGHMISARAFHAAVLLEDGTVLLVGGENAGGALNNTAEIYNPTKRTFTLTAAPHFLYFDVPAIRLQNGNVLLQDGQGHAELYEPSTSATPAKFVVTGSPVLSSSFFTGSLLSCGNVLFAGGFDFASGQATAATQVYDTALGKFEPSGYMVEPRGAQAATVLQDGTLLITSGSQSSSPIVTLPTAEVLTPEPTVSDNSGPIVIAGC